MVISGAMVFRPPPANPKAMVARPMAPVRYIAGRGSPAAVSRAADAEAAAIYASAYEKDPEFYRFVRSQEAYRKVFNEKTTLILSTSEMPFLQYLK